MDLIGVPPSDESRYAREVGAEEIELQAALRERAREVRRAASETVAHSQSLRFRVDRRFVRRCAWCSRYQVGERWVALGEVQSVASAGTTHTICDGCLDMLRAAGLSV